MTRTVHPSSGKRTRRLLVATAVASGTVMASGAAAFAVFPGVSGSHQGKAHTHDIALVKDEKSASKATKSASKKEHSPDRTVPCRPVTPPVKAGQTGKPVPTTSPKRTAAEKRAATKKHPAKTSVSAHHRHDAKRSVPGRDGQHCPPVLTPKATVPSVTTPVTSPPVSLPPTVSSPAAPTVTPTAAPVPTPSAPPVPPVPSRPPTTVAPTAAPTTSTPPKPPAPSTPPVVTSTRAPVVTSTTSITTHATA